MYYFINVRSIFLIASVIFLLGDQRIRSHGFSADTLLWTGNRQMIQEVCTEVVYNSIEHCTPSYDITRGVPVSTVKDVSMQQGSDHARCISHAEFCRQIQESWVRIKGAARSVTNCYIRIILGSRPHEAIRCSPLQEFYLPALRKWVPALDLEVGDELLSQYSLSCAVLAIELIEEQLPVYAISVEQPHAYFVSLCGVLTHNMPLPAIDCAIHIPWDMVFTTGGRLAVELGPVTCGFSLAVAAGVGIGYAVYRLTTQSYAAIDTYGITIDTEALNAYFQKKNSKSSGSTTKSSSRKFSKDNGNSGGGGGPRDPKDPKKRNTDKVANIYELFARAGFGTALQCSSEFTNDTFKGARIFKLVKDLAEYGLKKGDLFYLDTCHFDHLEVFRGGTRLLRGVWNLNGSDNPAKTLAAIDRFLPKR